MTSPTPGKEDEVGEARGEMVEVGETALVGEETGTRGSGATKSRAGNAGEMHHLLLLVAHLLVVVAMIVRSRLLVAHLLVVAMLVRSQPPQASLLVKPMAHPRRQLGRSRHVRRQLGRSRQV